jgi:hypothetical protein
MKANLLSRKKNRKKTRGVVGTAALDVNSVHDVH